MLESESLNVPLSHPTEILTNGMLILADVMTQHGFRSFLTASGSGSGGRFAIGEFQRADRRLELHFRYTVGLVRYHLRSTSISHEDYMWAVLGRRWASHYPGFSDEALDGFRHLQRDLDEYGQDFLKGSDAQFLEQVSIAATLKRKVSRLP